MDMRDFILSKTKTGSTVVEVNNETIRLPMSLDYADGLAIDKLSHWRELACRSPATPKPIFIIPGNDDAPATDNIFANAPFQWIDRQIITLGSGLQILGFGGSNITPWHTVREYTEEQIAEDLKTLSVHIDEYAPVIFFGHVPPFGTGLDDAPGLNADFSYKTAGGAPVMVPVGSSSVRSFIEERQPLLGLFGHVHEARGHTRIGRTFCINPGSSYHLGRLQGVIIKIENDKVIDFQFTEG